MPRDLSALAKRLDFGVQFGVGEAANLAGLALPDDARFCWRVPQRVTVEAVVAEVEFAADEPLGPGQIPLKNLVPGLEPVELAGRAGPECFGIFDGLLVEGFVLGEALDVRLGAELRGRRKDAVFAKRGVDIPVGNGKQAWKTCRVL